jgi:hypothetical protein
MDRLVAGLWATFLLHTGSYQIVRRYRLAHAAWVTPGGSL